MDFLAAPAEAVAIGLERTGITRDQVTVWEYNEAFADVIKINQKVSPQSLAKSSQLNPIPEFSLDISNMNPLGWPQSFGTRFQ